MKSMKFRVAVLASLLAVMAFALSACSGQEGKVSNRPQNAPADWEKKNLSIDG